MFLVSAEILKLPLSEVHDDGVVGTKLYASSYIYPNHVMFYKFAKMKKIFEELISRCAGDCFKKGLLDNTRSANNEEIIL